MAISNGFVLPAIASDPDAFKVPLQLLGGFILTLWALELVDILLLRGQLNRLGIRPRRLIGLRGILFAPLLHGNLAHLAANTIPLAVLGWLIMLNGLNTFLLVTAVVWLVSGVGAWLLGGTNTMHLGASGLVFGYFGFLLLRGYFEQSFSAIAIAVLVGLLYGSMIWGVLPIHRGKSWQSHLFGFVGGGIVARYLPELQEAFTQSL
ncbi:MAG: rhomboid family intramembrane serine protease [Oscillatoriales cyanobacterium C42_A2020_001]|nr:rhomboid family intramembrane serine protease [Leptolyngbyaceae cyanobacterium C42_A2020_001]